MTKAFLDTMIEYQRGHIVTIASLQGIYAYSHSLCYCATKFGVTGFMLGLVEFLRQSGVKGKVHATCVLPDVIATREDLVKIVNSKK
jgi:short-subunit dehydrogenase